MTLKVTIGRSLTIDTTRCAVGDILLVELEHGASVRLQPVRSTNLVGHRWRYTNRSWLPADRQQIGALERRFHSKHGEVAKPYDIAAEVFNLQLDAPLTCTVFLRPVGHDRNKKGGGDAIGTLISAGGSIRNVTVSTLL